MGLSDQIQQAKDAGYTDDEIGAHLSPRLSEQVKAAEAAGYPAEKVREHLAGQGVPEPLAFDLTASAPEKLMRAAGPALRAVAEPLAGAKEALAAPIEAPGEAVDALGRRLRAGAAQEIPGLKTIADLQARGPENAAMVSEAVARAGYPNLAVPAGVLAGAPTVASQIVAPVPATVGEAEVLAAGAAAVPMLAEAGNALPILGEALPPAEYAANVIRRRLGLGGPSGLVRVDPAEALASGKMGLAEAAQQDPAIKAAEIARRGMVQPKPFAATEGAPARPAGGTDAEVRYLSTVSPNEPGALSSPTDGQIPPSIGPRRLAVPGTAGAPPPILEQASKESIPVRSVPVKGSGLVGRGDLADILDEGARDFNTTPDDPSLPAYIAHTSRELGNKIAPELERLAPSLAPKPLAGLRESVARDIQRLRELHLEAPESWHAAVKKADEYLLKTPAERQAPAASDALLSNKEIEKVTGRKAWQLTPEEYKAAAPANPIEDHRDAVFNAMWRQQPVSPEVAAAYPELADELARREYEMQIEPLEAERPTALGIIRKMGIDPENYGRHNKGELKSLEDSPYGRFIFREGGARWDHVVEAMWEHGIIPENNNNMAIDAVNDEIRESGLGGGIFRRGQGGFARMGGDDAYQQPPPPKVQAYDSRISEFKGRKTSLRKSFEEFFRQVVDENNPTLELRKQAKGHIEPSSDPRFLIKRYMSSAGIAENRIRNATTRFVGDKIIETGEGLEAILRDINKEFGDKAKDDIFSYMLAQRDVYQASRGIRGVSPENAPANIAYKLQQYGPKINGFAARLRGWMHRTYIEPLVDSGVLSAEQAKKFDPDKNFYIPYDRVFSDVEPNWSETFGGGNPIKELKGSERGVYTPLGKMIELAFRTAEHAERNTFLRSIVELRKAGLDDLIVEQKGGGEGTLPVMFNGEKRFFKVPADVLNSLQNTTRLGLDMVVKILRPFAAMKRSGITMDPQFAMMRNLLRDQLAASMQSKYGYTIGIDFVRAMLEEATGGKYFKEYMSQGGLESTLVAMDRAAADKNYVALTGEAIPNPLKLLQKISSTGEMGTRLGVYIRARNAGATPVEALYESKEATIDFAIKPGSRVLQAWEAATAFMRPNILGIARTARQFHDAPGKTSLRIATHLVLPSIALWAINKDDKNYQELPDWQKMSFWNIPVGNGRFFPFPKPLEYVVFASFPEAVLNHIYKKDPKILDAFIKKALDTFTPPYIPSVLDTAVDMRSNYNSYTGRPIIPKSRANMLPRDQYGDFTSETAKELGRRMEYPPSKIDYAIGGYGGTLARRLVSLGLDPALVAMQKKPAPAKAEQPFEDLILARKAIGSNSESVNRFYDYLTQMEQAHNSINANMRGVNVDAGPMLGLFRSSRDQMNNIKRMEATITASKMTPENKRALLNKYDKIITNLAGTMVRTYEGQASSGRQVR